VAMLSALQHTWVWTGWRSDQTEAAPVGSHGRSGACRVHGGMGNGWLAGPSLKAAGLSAVLMGWTVMEAGPD
jgi:hypothetical protein